MAKMRLQWMDWERIRDLRLSCSDDPESNYGQSGTPGIWILQPGGRVL